MNAPIFRILLAPALLCAGAFSAASAQDSTGRSLPPIVVQVGRDAGRSALDLPFAITTLTPDSMRPAQRHTGLEEALFSVPGVLVFNRNNPAQDARISIRGFGARSSFGVRGIRVMRDGIPLTLPDGQTPVDYLDLENVGRIDVLRGSASSLYGNAGGGVIDIRSSRPGDSTLSANARAWSGSDASGKLVAQTAARLGALSYQTNASRWTSNGFRDYSRQQTTTADILARLTSRGTDYSMSFEGFETPVAQSPGAVTLAQWQADPRSADPLSVRKQAGKIVKQTQFGTSAAHSFIGGGEIRASVNAGRRSLYNPLTFAIVAVRRHTSGADIRGTLPLAIAGLQNRFSAGVELQRQGDDRKNFTNCTDLTTPLTKPTASCEVGASQGSTTLDQRELVKSSGFYLGDEVNLSARYILMASARADAVRFTVTDHLINATNPDDSGNRTLHAISPMTGVTVRLNQVSSLYANASTAFETPTATELGNHPDGSAGINQDLRPQKSLTYEIGFRGLTVGGLRYNGALFATGVRDELIPFEIPASSGRRYFRNAGRTSRRGAELSLVRTLAGIDWGWAYTYGDFKYRDFTVAGISYAGNRIPGVPAHELQTSATAHLSQLSLVAEAVVSGRVFVDDANSLAAPGYGTLNLRVNIDQLVPKSGISVISGIYNVFDKSYISSVAVNASAAKFFEPGQGRSYFVGFNLGFAQKR